ncbi:efflux RND transporter periplasmic adaptor subunit [Williamwhitmania taraxaci]|uniref:HlyD family secretion protein n=1 Tax=Williamwhitmania taraxaci TaxID=1640674 RepID=A0A1G6H7L8_9BACT|nr:efflux RND transporter periplasmic adaptor subunit [Williamwhitmania taraxaci]SDB90279.1 HlyD family secretion protein [Williamwhitmania taraxaci]
MKKKNNILKYAILGVVIVALLLVVGKSAGWLGKEISVKVAIERPTKRTIVETITANGKVQPVKEVKISPDVSGEIVELMVKEGDKVNKGDLLVKIKPDTYVSGMERAEAALNSSNARLLQTEAQLQMAKLAYDRNKELFAQKAISQADFESAESQFKVAKGDYEAARFSVKSADATVKEARESLAKTTIYAPVSGTISKLNVEKGERVVGTMQMAGTELMRLANLNNMEVRVDVNENDIVRVKYNDTALIEVDAYMGRKFKGIVTQIANSASVQGGSADQVTSFEVRVLLLEDSYADLTKKGIANPFRPGMSATVDIQTERKENVMTLPIQAITILSDTTKMDMEKKSGSKEEKKPEAKSGSVDAKKSVSDKPVEVVFVVTKTNKVKHYAVKTGIQDDSYIEIISGLTDSMEVVIAPFSVISRRLKDSVLVQKVPKDKLFEKE